MPLKFRTEIKEMFGKEYIKVFLLNMVDSSKVKTLLESLYCINRVNESNDGKDLTAYPTKLYTAVEAETEINTTLVAFYSTKDNKKTIEKLKMVGSSLESHTKSQCLYEEAIQNINAGGSNRSTLDNIRLSMEQYLQEVIGNKNVLENQEKPLKQFLKSKGATTEVVTSITQFLHSFYKYQDNNVKHDSNVKKEDVDYFLDMANAIINQVQKYE